MHSALRQAASFTVIGGTVLNSEQNDEMNLKTIGQIEHCMDHCCHVPTIGFHGIFADFTVEGGRIKSNPAFGSRSIDLRGLGSQMHAWSCLVYPPWLVLRGFHTQGTGQLGCSILVIARKRINK